MSLISCSTPRRAASYTLCAFSAFSAAARQFLRLSGVSCPFARHMPACASTSLIDFSPARISASIAAFMSAICFLLMGIPRLTSSSALRASRCARYCPGIKSPPITVNAAPMLPPISPSSMYCAPSITPPSPVHGMSLSYTALAMAFPTASSATSSNPSLKNDLNTSSPASYIHPYLDDFIASATFFTPAGHSLDTIFPPAPVPAIFCPSRAAFSNTLSAPPCSKYALAMPVNRNAAPASCESAPAIAASRAAPAAADSPEFTHCIMRVTCPAPAPALPAPTAPSP